jgi:Tfp pilus assembly protein PilO
MANLLDKLGLGIKKLILIILVSVVIIYVDCAFIIKLQVGSIGSAKTKIIKLKKDIAALYEDLVLMQQSQDQRKQKTFLKAKTIVSEDEMTVLLQGIYNLANKDKVRIIQIRPLKDPKAKEEVMGSQKVTPMAIAMNLSCAYHSLGSFINDLENAEQFLAVQDLKIVRSPGDYMCLNVTLNLKTYVKK